MEFTNSLYRTQYPNWLQLGYKAPEVEVRVFKLVADEDVKSHGAMRRVCRQWRKKSSLFVKYCRILHFKECPSIPFAQLHSFHALIPNNAWLPENAGALFLQLSALYEIIIGRVACDEIKHLVLLTRKTNLTRFEVTIYVPTEHLRHPKSHEVPTARYIVNSLRLLPNLTRVDLPHDADDANVKDLTTFSRLNHLDIPCGIRGDHVTVLRKLPLQSLKIRVTCFLAKIYTHIFELTHLNSLSLDHSISFTRWNIEVQNFTYPFGKMTNLQELKLLSVKNLSQKRYSQLTQLTKLKSLELECCDLSSGRAFEMIGQLSSLRLLRIKDCIKIDEISFSEVAELDRLESLTLDSGQTTARMFIDCARLTNLTSLRITALEVVFDKSIESLTALSKLRKLTLHRLHQTACTIEFGVAKETATDKLNLVRHLPDLRSLRLINFDDCALTVNWASQLNDRVRIQYETSNQNIIRQLDQHVYVQCGTPQQFALPRIKYTLFA